MANKRRKERPSDRAKSAAAHALPIPDSGAALSDVRMIQLAGAAMTVILVGAIWWNRFLPMQDYPQHLFMAIVANEYDNPSLNYAENFELRNQFGPYRATHLALRGLCHFASPEVSTRLWLRSTCY